MWYCAKADFLFPQDRARVIATIAGDLDHKDVFRANTFILNAIHGIREGVMRNFEFARVPFLIVGLLAAFACLVWWRAAFLNPAYVLAITMWALAASRIPCVGMRHQINMFR